MDAAHAIEFASLLLVGSLIFVAFIAAAVVSFIGAVATFNHGEEQPFVEVNLQKPVGPGESGVN
jgi:hypothetical protein